MSSSRRFCAECNLDITDLAVGFTLKDAPQHQFCYGCFCVLRDRVDCPNGRHLWKETENGRSFVCVNGECSAIAPCDGWKYQRLQDIPGLCEGSVVEYARKGGIVGLVLDRCYTLGKRQEEKHGGFWPIVEEPGLSVSPMARVWKLKRLFTPQVEWTGICKACNSKWKFTYHPLHRDEFPTLIGRRWTETVLEMERCGSAACQSLQKKTS